MKRTIAIILAAFLATVLQSARGAESLSEYRSLDRGLAFDISLGEKERFPRYSVFKTSAPISDREKALFMLCSFAEFASARGFTHIAVIEPAPGDDLYVVGLFSAETEDIREAFGSDQNVTRVLSQRPGAVATIHTICGGKSQ